MEPQSLPSLSCLPQARRNTIRAAFTFVVVFLDYMLMLVSG